MVQLRNKVCGVDIHKRFFVATILSRDGTKMQSRFETNIKDLLSFRDWIIENNCDCVAVESTGVYWHPIHNVLENRIELILANAHQIKHTPGRKTDALDSEWIAELALNNLIDPSRILPKNDRDLRRLTRTRESGQGSISNKEPNSSRAGIV
jgi:transposase